MLIQRLAPSSPAALVTQKSHVPHAAPHGTVDGMHAVFYDNCLHV